MASPSGSGGPQADFNNSARDSYIPLFSGAPTDYKEWRKRITLYHQKMVLSKRRGESILNIVGSLSGSAWRLLEDFDVSKAEQENAFTDILKLLDKHFQYDDRVALPNDFDSYFQFLRKPGQTLLNYVTEHDELHRRLERHSVALPNKVQGWHLLRRSGLTRDQRQMVMLKAPQLDKKDVIEALYLIFGQDQKGVNHERPRHHFRGKGGKGRGYYVEEEMGFYYDENDETYYDYDDEAGYYEDSEWPAESYDDWHEDENFDATAVYYQDDDAAGDEAETPFPVETYDEAYAAYVDARKRFSDLRLSRGFLPVVALSDPSAGNLSPGLSSPGGSPGHGKGKKGGKGKGSGGKGKNWTLCCRMPCEELYVDYLWFHKTFSSVTGSYGKV